MAESQGSKITETLRVRHFDGLPSPHQFRSQIEPANAPAVFGGAVKDWEASSRWDPRNGGLGYLKEKVGCVIVEVMLSKSGSIFYGDLQSHERVPLPFSTFITSCEACLSADLKHNSDDGAHVATVKVTPDHGKEFSSSNVVDAAQLGQLYLAQVPILNTEYDEMATLGSLQDDFHMPSVLEKKQLVSINFWMNGCLSRSSTHYDPHHNLLCVIAGSKQVMLWPPSATPSLYPKPVYGEASNHSSIDILNPDLVLHPRFKYSADYHQKVILNAGDALFLPEGWFHQVDSACLTIAINFWWQSEMMSKISEHMDSYYLRRIVNRLVTKEMDLMLHWSSSSRPTDNENLCLAETSDDTSSADISNSGEPRENSLQRAHALDDIEPCTLLVLHELVSIVHEHVNSGRSASSSSEVQLKDEQGGNSTSNSSRLEEDRVASLLWSLKPLMLRKLLLSLVNIFPRTLEALILHTISPMAAEVLTRKFDEMDHLSSRDQRNKFYQAFYGVFQDHFTAMDSLLSGKESISFQALGNVLEQHLGCQIGQQKKLEGAPVAPANNSMPAQQSPE